MNREDFIPLGSIVEDTKGPGIGGDDGVGEQLKLGLADE